MKVAGIQIVFALWYGPHSDTDRVIPLLLDEAQRQNMKGEACPTHHRPSPQTSLSPGRGDTQ